MFLIWRRWNWKTSPLRFSESEGHLSKRRLLLETAIACGCFILDITCVENLRLRLVVTMHTYLIFKPIYWKLFNETGHSSQLQLTISTQTFTVILPLRSNLKKATHKNRRTNSRGYYSCKKWNWSLIMSQRYWRIKKWLLKKKGRKKFSHTIRRAAFKG